MGSLENAAKAATPQDQLSALLAAWRQHRHPRIADLIDRVSEQVTRDLPRVKGKSVPERVKAVVALCETKDPADVGRILATEWPGTWQAALPMLQAVVALPDDPRVARELARQVDLTRYDTWTSNNFYRPLFARLNALKDVRNLPLLEAQLKRSKSYYYERDMRRLEEAAVAVLRQVEVPALPQEDEAILGRLEAPFRSKVAAEKSAGKSGEELLAAVYAHPEDLGARAVYGDWLMEHGDPRGELISLQLADKNPSRQKSIIKKHWKAWLGPICDWFPQPPDFKAGFPVAGRVDSPTYRNVQETLRPLLDRPEWRTFEHFTSWPASAIRAGELLRHPNFQALKRLDWNADDQVPEILEAKPALTGLKLHLYPDARPFPLEQLPTLRWVSIRSPLIHVVESVLRQLDELHVEDASELSPENMAKIEGSGVPSVVLDQYGASVRLSRPRGAPHFTTLEISTMWDPEYLERALRSVSPTLTTLAPVKEKRELSEKALEKLRAVLDRFPGLEGAALPFEQEFKRPPQPHVSVTLSGVALLDEARLPELWKLLHDDFGATLDTFEVGSKPRSFGDDDPVKRLTVWAKNARTRSVYLRLSGGETVVPLHKDSSSYTCMVLPFFDGERFAAALERLLTWSRPTHLRLTRGKESLEFNRAKVETMVKETRPLLGLS